MTSKTTWLDAEGGLVAGIYESISDADYQAIDALRASTTKEALQSALQLRYRMDTPRTDTGALRLGRAVHIAVLQPHMYAADVAIIPAEFAVSTGLSKKKPALEWASSIADGVTVITADEHATTQAIADAAAKHDAARTMLDRAKGREVTAIWREVTPQGVQVWCKARADFIGGDILGDLKTMGGRKRFDARGIASTIAEYQYHYQMGWYERGFIAAAAQSGSDADYTALDWAWVFVQSTAPHDAIACTADDEMQDIGRWYAQSAWETYASALDSDDWPGVAPECVTVSLPRWAVPVDDSDDDFDYLEDM